MPDGTAVDVNVITEGDEPVESMVASIEIPLDVPSVKTRAEPNFIFCGIPLIVNVIVNVLPDWFTLNTTESDIVLFLLVSISKIQFTACKINPRAH